MEFQQLDRGRRWRCVTFSAVIVGFLRSNLNAIQLPLLTAMRRSLASGSDFPVYLPRGTCPLATATDWGKTFASMATF